MFRSKTFILEGCFKKLQSFHINFFGLLKDNFPHIIGLVNSFFLSKLRILLLKVQCHEQCCGAGAGTFWPEPEPVLRTGSGSGSTIDEKLNFKNVPQKFTEDTTCNWL